MKKSKIFVAIDTTKISKAKKIIKETKTDKIKIGYKFGLEFLNSKGGRNFVSKLKNKNCDWIIANDVSNNEIGFNSNYNEVTIHYKNPSNKKEKLSLKKKTEISEEIVDRIIAQIN